MARSSTPSTCRIALEQLHRPDALDILRARPSFQHFEQQVRSW
ncbi:MAG TPA: hypothetical protein VF794_25500 [Archangium sp.]|jgi:hypothetical protein